MEDYKNEDKDVDFEEVDIDTVIEDEDTVESDENTEEGSLEDAETSETQAEKNRLAYERRQKAKSSKQINPYTGQPVESDYDEMLLSAMQALEQEGKDPFEDLPEKLIEVERDNVAKANSQDQRALIEEEASNSIKEANESFGVDVEKMFVEDKEFREFTKARIDKGGKLNEILKDYFDRETEIAHKAEARARDLQAKSKATPGSVYSGGKQFEAVNADELFELALRGKLD